MQSVADPAGDMGPAWGGGVPLFSLDGAELPASAVCKNPDKAVLGSGEKWVCNYTDRTL